MTPIEQADAFLTSLKAQGLDGSRVWRDFHALCSAAIDTGDWSAVLAYIARMTA